MRNRKIISLILFISFMSGFTNVNVFASDKPQIILDMQFDNVATYDSPKGVDFKGKWVETVEQNSSNYSGKCLRIFAPEGDASAQIPFSHKENKVVIEGDFKFDDFESEKQLFILNGTDKKMNEVIKIAKNGSIVAFDGKKIAAVQKNQWVNIAAVVNFKLKKTDIYINRDFVRTVLFSNSAMTGVSSVKFGLPVNSKNSEMLIDNLRIYAGGVLLDDSNFPKAEYNFRTLTKTPEDYAEEPESNAIHLNEDCNNYTEGNEGPWTIINKENTIKVVDVPNSTDKSMMIELDKNDPYIEVGFSNVNSKKVVVEARVRSDDTNAEKALFTIKDSNGGFNSVATMTLNGEIISYNNRSITKYAKKTWYDLAVTLNLETMTSDYYLNGKKVLENINLANQSLADISVLRFQCFNAASKSALYIDNIKMYDGSVPKTLEELGNDAVVVKGTEMFIPEKRVTSRIGDATVLVVGRKYAYENRKKITIPSAPFVNENGVVMIPLRTVAEAYGGNITFNESDNLVEVNFPDNKKVTFHVGSTEMFLGDKKINSAEPPVIMDGSTFVPLNMFAEKILGENVFYGELGLIIISGKDNRFNAEDDKEDLKNIYDFIYYTRPKADRILADLAVYSPDNLHPRILLRNDDFDKIRSNYETDTNTRTWVEDIRNNVEKNIMSTEPQKYEIPDGLRLTGASQNVQSRVMQLAILYRLFGDKKYAERAWKELECAANYKDWNANRHFLDTGEMAAGFGIGYDWLYDYLSEEQKKVLIDAIIKHGLEPTRNAYNGIGASGYFVTMENNWNIICNGGIALSALAIAEEAPELAGEILERGMESTEYMMSNFFPDGGWFEGVGYWYYQSTYIAYYATALRTALGTDYGFYDIPGLKDTGYFPIFGNGPMGVFDFHDSGSGFYNSPELFFFAKMNRDADLAKLRLENMEKRKFLGSVKDLLWYEPDLVSEKVELPLDKKFAEVEMGAFRSGWNDDATYIGFHAGENSVPHANLDAGTFIIDALGERWATELGGDDYNLEGYFGDKRWEYYRMRGEGQNVLIMNPSGSYGQSLRGFTRITEFESKPQGAKAVLDLSSVFQDYAKNVKRGFKFDDNRRRIVIQDEGEMKKPSDLMWNMHTKADVEISKDGKTAMLSLGQKKMWMALDTNIPDVVFSVMDAVPLSSSPHPNRQNANKGIRKVVINAENVIGKYNIAVTFIPVYDITNARLEKAEFEDIENWSIPDGEKEIANVTAIIADGIELSDYMPTKYNYEIRQTVGYSEVPQIGVVVPDNMTADIKQAKRIPDIATIIVTEKNDPKNRTVYSVSMIYAPKLGLPENMSKHTLRDVVVSDEPQTENNGLNLIDGKIDTRWSADGIQTATFELEGVKKISAVALSFYLGERRTTKFDIMVSKDGTEWANVFSGSSTGLTNEYESVYFDECDAKYIKFRGYGNSENTWTSLNEMIVYGK